VVDGSSRLYELGGRGWVLQKGHQRKCQEIGISLFDFSNSAKGNGRHEEVVYPYGIVIVFRASLKYTVNGKPRYEKIRHY